MKKKTLFAILVTFGSLPGFAQSFAEKANTLINEYASQHKFSGTVLLAKRKDCFT